jgi:hypothetical protein
MQASKVGVNSWLISCIGIGKMGLNLKFFGINKRGDIV